MENSISLGLLHGLVYGIVPAAPWFVALKRYLLEGKERGQLAVAGTIAGQVSLLALTFFGWNQVLWIWYYFEPALIILGTMAVGRCALDCWVEQTSSLQTEPVPLANKKEGFYYFLVNFGLMFCNPAHLEGSQTLISSIPGNRYFYLIAFTIAYSAIILAFWATLGYRIFGKAYAGFGPQQTLTRYRMRRVAVAMVAALFTQFANCTPEALVVYHWDSLLTYTSLDQFKHHKTRGYVWEPVTNGSITHSRQSTRSTNKQGILMDQEEKADITHQPMWNNQVRYDECNQIRERELDNDEWNEEASFHEFGGVNQATLHARLVPFNLYMVPKWERQENKDFVLTLRKIRDEMDEKLLSSGNSYAQNASLPFSDEWDVELDYIINPSALAEKAESKGAYKDMQKFIRSTKWTSNHLHLGNGFDTEASYAKLHKLPAEVRLPWHYPAVKPLETKFLPPSSRQTPEEREYLNQQIQANASFLANEPERIQPDIYRRLSEYRMSRKTTPRPFDAEREARLKAESDFRRETYSIPEEMRTK